MWAKDAPPHHLYVVVEGNEPHADHVDFRNYLRQHAAVAEEYASLKKKLADRNATDRAGYADTKSEFIERVLAAARAR